MINHDRFFHKIRVRFAEVDKHGHVFNAHYLTYFDSSITEYLRYRNVLNYPEFKQICFLVKKVQVEYFNPIVFDQEMNIYVNVAQFGHSSIRFNLEITLTNDTVKCVGGEVIWVCVDPVTKIKSAIPLWLKEKLYDTHDPLIHLNKEII